MSLAGHGVVTIWNDIAEGNVDEFLNWHNNEHIPERIGIPGFLRARRYRSLSTGPQFFQLYELDSANALTGSDYTHRLNTPTEWTRKLSPVFQNSSRALCKVLFSHGRGQGGHLATIRFDMQGDEQEIRERRRALAISVLPLIAENFRIAGVHLCVRDIDVILIEGATDLDALVEVCDSSLSAEILQAAEPPLRDLYELQFSRCKLPWSIG